MININNQTFTNIIITILILLNVGLGYALWQSKKQHHPPRPEKAAKLFENKLDLSETQTQEFIQLIDEHHIYHRQVNNKQRAFRTQLFGLMIEEKLDTLKIQETLGLFGDTEAAKFQSLIDHYRNLKGVCTPEQQIKLYNFFKYESRIKQDQRKGPRH